MAGWIAEPRPRERTPEQRRADAFGDTVRQMIKLGYSRQRIAEATGRSRVEIGDVCKAFGVAEAAD